MVLDHWRAPPQLREALRDDHDHRDGRIIEIRGRCHRINGTPHPDRLSRHSSIDATRQAPGSRQMALTAASTAPGRTVGNAVTSTGAFAEKLGGSPGSPPVRPPSAADSDPSQGFAIATSRKMAATISQRPAAGRPGASATGVNARPPLPPDGRSPARSLRAFIAPPRLILPQVRLADRLVLLDLGRRPGQDNRAGLEDICPMGD